MPARQDRRAPVVARHVRRRKPRRPRASRIAARPPTHVRRRGSGIPAARRELLRREGRLGQGLESSALAAGIRTPTHRPCSSARSNAMSAVTGAHRATRAARGTKRLHASCTCRHPRRRLGHAVLARVAPAHPQAAPAARRPRRTSRSSRATVRRIEPLIAPDRVWIATGASLVEATLAALPARRAVARPRRAGRPQHGALHRLGGADDRPHRSRTPIVAVLPADHFIADEPAFRDVLERPPSAPPTKVDHDHRHRAHAPGDGLRLHRGRRPRSRRASHAVTQLRREARRASAPRLSWPTGATSGTRGMFFFRARVMKAAIAEHLPALAARARPDRRGRAPAATRRASSAEVFPTLAVDLDRPRRHGEGDRHRGRARATSAGTTSEAGRSPGSWPTRTRRATRCRPAP